MQYLEISKDPQKVMSEYGKSFYFASQVFSKSMMERVSYLYSFCRYVDDCADELAADKARLAVKRIREGLKGNLEEGDLKSLILRLESYGIQKEHLEVLVDGASFDADEEVIVSEEDLLKYCFKVAGVVGLMLCPLMGVKDTKASYYAVDLGIGMQLTNICRDILEDAQNNRNYLPLKELETHGLSVKKLSSKGYTPFELKEVVKNYLDLADAYYSSALDGIAYIPFRARFAILIASQVYRAIGVKIKKQDYDVLKGRTYLTKFEKIKVSLRTSLFLFNKRFWFPRTHRMKLYKNALYGEIK